MPQGVYYSLVSAPTAFTAYPRFAPKYWTTSGSLTGLNGVVTLSTSSLTFYGELNVKGDLVELTWSSQDTFSHPVLRYVENDDYTGITWSFTYASTSNILYSFTSSTTPPSLTIAYANTSLSSSIAAGATTLPLASTSGILAGDALLLVDSPNSEYVTVLAVFGDHVTLTTGTAYGHNAETQVQDVVFVNLQNYAQVGYTAYNADIVLNFDTLHSGLNSSDPAWKPVRSNAIKSIAFSMAAKNYSQNAMQPLPSGYLSCSITVSSMVVTSNVGSSPNATLNVGFIANPTDVGLALTTNYDNVQNLSPERLVAEFLELGYTRSIDHFLGTRYYGLVWNAGTSSFMVDASRTFNSVTTAWNRDMYARLTSAQFAFVTGLGLEIFTPFLPSNWDQQNVNGVSGHTGYTPSNTIARFMRSDTRAFLESCYVALLSLLPASANAGGLVLLERLAFISSIRIPRMRITRRQDLLRPISWEPRRR